MPKPDNTKRFPRQFKRRERCIAKMCAAAPCTAVHLIAVFFYMPIKLQDERKYQLGDAVGTVAGNIRYGDTGSMSGFYVNNIIAGRQHADVPQLG